MAESDDYPELVPESSTVSIAAHNAFDRDVLDAEKGFHHIAGYCPTKYAYRRVTYSLNSLSFYPHPKIHPHCGPITAILRIRCRIG